jgi:sulfite exporter TauE/SafE
MVYGVLALAIVSGTVLSGAAVMLAFGLGTLPTLVGLGWLGGRLGNRVDRRGLQKLIGGLIVLFAVAGLARMRRSGQPARTLARRDRWHRA